MERHFIIDTNKREYALVDKVEEGQELIGTLYSESTKQLKSFFIIASYKLHNKLITMDQAKQLIAEFNN